MTTTKLLTTRITAHRRQPGLDNLGQAVVDWQQVATLWASVRRLAERDLNAADQRRSSSSISVVIRTRHDITAGMRIGWDGRLWDIVGEPVPLDRQFVRFEAASGVGVAVSG